MATSYTGLRVQDTYNAIIKIGDNSNLTGTPKLLSDGLGNDSPLYLSGTRLGIGISPAYQFHTSGNAKIGGNLIISGNLTVNGTLTYLNVEDLAVEDPLIKLAKDNTANTLDIGLFGKYVATGTKYKGFFNDASDDKFKLFIGTTVEPTTTVDTSASGYTMGTLVANIEGATGTFSGLLKSDTLELTSGADHLTITESSGDWTINNSQQDNGIKIYDGTGGIDLIYNGSSYFEVDVTGVHTTSNINFYVDTNTLYVDAANNLVGIGKTPSTYKLDVNGKIASNNYIIAGLGNGGVALTHNDGQGNANVTFNHVSGIPEQNGNSFRIIANTDSSTNAYMGFEIKEGVTADTAVSTIEVFRLDPDGPKVRQAGGGNISLQRDDASIVDGNPLGRIRFSGDDPTNSVFNRGVEIRAEAAGTWSTDNYPSELQFYTTATNTDELALTLDSSQNAEFKGDILISKNDPKLTFFDSTVNTDPSGQIVFSELSGHRNFDINYNGTNDRLEFRGKVGENEDTDLMYINRNSTDTVQIIGGLRVNGTIKDSDGDAGTSGQLLSSTGTGTNWIDFEADVAKRIDVTVKNVSGGSLAKGVVVHAAPTATPPSGNVIEVIAADANDATKMPSIGVLNETIADEAEGEAVMFGAVSGIDTSSFSIGDELYVSTTAGELTATKPTANDELVQKVAIVIKSHASNGLIKVFGAGRANDVPNLVDRDISFSEVVTIAQDDANDRLKFTRSGHDTYELYLRDSQGLGIYNSTDDRIEMQFGGQGNIFFGDNTGTRRLILFGANSQTTSSELIFGDSSGQAAPEHAGMGIRYDSSNNQLSIRSFFDSAAASTRDVPIALFDRENLESTFYGDIKQSTRTTLHDNGTITWGSSNNFGELSWDGDYALYRGKSGKGIKLQTDGSTTAVTIDTSQNAIFDGTVTAANVFIADDIDVTNATPSTDQLRASGYGIIGSRGLFYITNAQSGGSVQIGNGTSHNADPTALFSGTIITHKRDTIIEGDLTLTKGQITTNIGTTSHLYISPDSTTNTTGKTSMFLGTSTVDNYGISLRGARFGDTGTPKFELAVHNNSANGSVALEVDQFINTHIKGELFIEDVDNATAADTDKVLVMSNESGEVQYRTPTQLADDMNVPTGIGGAGLIPIFETTNTFTTNSNLYWDIANGRLGLGDTTPSYRLDLVTGSVDTQQYSMRISHTRNDPDQNSAALFLRGVYSGTKSNATDIVQRGLHVDVDSSASGDASNEHRLYGIHSDTRNSGFADVVYGTYSLAESNYTGAKTANVGGVYGIATHDANNTSGGVTNLFGVKGIAQVQDDGDVDVAMGGQFQTLIANNRDANVDQTIGVWAEIQIDEQSALTYSDMYGYRSIIDNNEASVPTFGNQFLFHGDYQGTRGGAAYGVYCEGDRHYLEGLVSIGNNNISGGMPLNVYHASNSQIRFTTAGTGTASNDGFRVGYNGTVGQLFLYENADIRIATNNTPFAYFSSDQKFGIGTDTPAHDIDIESTNPTLILTQSGAVNQANSGRILFAEAPAYSSGHFEIKYDGANNRLRFNSPIDGTTNLMNIGRDGLIGIDIATPTYKLDIRDAGSSGINISGTGAFVRWNSGDMQIRNDGSYAMAFDTWTGSALTEKLLIDSSGNQTLNLSSTTTQFLGNSSGTFTIKNTTGGVNIMANGSTVVSAYITSSLITLNEITQVNNTLRTSTAMGTAGEWDAARIRVEATNTIDTTGFTGIRFATSTANNYGWSMGANRVGSGLGDFRIYEHRGSSTGFHRVTIKNDTGYVGVKDSTPSYHIDVNGTIRATGDVIAYSDRRVKDNIETIENGLEKVTKLRGVSYTRNDIEDDTTKIGVIAQEVLEVLPEVVKQDDRGKYSVSYGNMAGLFIEAIKDLKAEINELKEEIKELKSK